MVKIGSFCLLGLFFTASSFAQSTVPVSVVQPAEWFAVYSTLDFSKKVSVVVDGNFRFVQKMQPQQHMLRGGLELNLTDKLSIVPLGYAYVFNYRYGKQPAEFANNEYRFWQQVQYKYKIGSVSFGHRLRMEERFIEMHKVVANEVEYDGFSNEQFRLRYRLNISVPLIQPVNYRYLYFNTWDELHYGWGKNVHYYKPNQNRLYAGLGYQLNKTIAFQCGAIYQWLKKDNGVQSENNIGVMVQANFSFDLRKH